MAETREFDACLSKGGKPTDDKVKFRTFDTWEQVLEYVKANGHIFYKGALNYKPERVQAKVHLGQKVRTDPTRDQADPWTMDSSYLNLCWEKVG